MRMILSMVLGAMLLLGQTSVAQQQESKKDEMSQKEKMSYSLGYKNGSTMKNSSIDLDLDIYLKAFREGFAGSKAALTDPEMVNAIQELQREMKAKQPGKKESAEKNKKAGEAFLAENAKKEGVVTLPSGLQYKIIKEGAGKQPAKTDRVKVHYRGTLINGTEFFDSYKKGTGPTSLGVDKFIKGLTEGLQLMKEGSKWTFYVPSNLAYGARGMISARAKGAKSGSKPPLIGPNQTLIFEVELIEIEQ